MVLSLFFLFTYFLFDSFHLFFISLFHFMELRFLSIEIKITHNF